ncbi:hypothetical protein [unidentified bacterial endosymbiont]|uniref:hypothetical protein n=1 Tax=unidentified bacterial endosymbiont TaxID=2355 RepID=UPI00209E7CDD|nr:hypothetical protein [unidentified bacterial endosymbiont]
MLALIEQQAHRLGIRRSLSTVSLLVVPKLLKALFGHRVALLRCLSIPLHGGLSIL